MTQTTLPADLETRLAAADTETQLDAVFELLASLERDPQLALSVPARSLLWQALLQGAEEDEALLAYTGEALVRLLGREALGRGLIERLEPSQPVEQRVAAARALAELGSAEAVPLLQQMLTDLEPAVRAAAAAALPALARGTAAEPAVRKQLLERLADEAEALEVLRAIATHLREIPSKETVEALLALLEDKHGDEELQASAVRTLSYEPEASKRLVKGLSRILKTWRRETAVKVEAARTLAYTQSDAALPALVEHLNDGNPAVRAACAEALGHFELPSLIEPLAEVLHNPYESAAIRRLAALSNGQIGSAPHVDDQGAQLAAAALLDMLEELIEEGTREPGLFVSLADALGRFGGEPIVAALRYLLELDEPEVREAALRAYATQGTAERVDVLSEVLSAAQDEEVRIVAVEELARLADPASEAVLLGVLDDPDEFIRARAVHGLGRMKSRKAVPQLLSWLDEPATPGGLVQHALDALGRIGDETVVPALERAFQRARLPVRIKAAGALTRFGYEPARRWLHEHVGESAAAHPHEALAAALELAELHDPAALPVLLSRLMPQDGDEVRLKVVQALRHFQEEPQARAALEKIAAQPDILLRDAARGHGGL